MTWKQRLVSGQFKLSKHLEKFTYVSTVCVSFSLWLYFCQQMVCLDIQMTKKRRWRVGLFKLTLFWNYQDKCRWATASEDHWVLLLSAKNRKRRLSLHERTKSEQQGNEKDCLYELALIPCNNEVQLKNRYTVHFHYLSEAVSSSSVLASCTETGKSTCWL